jgi:hypothetical protein
MTDLAPFAGHLVWEAGQGQVAPEPELPDLYAVRRDRLQLTAAHSGSGCAYAPPSVTSRSRRQLPSSMCRRERALAGNQT